MNVHMLSRVRLFCDPMDCSPTGSTVHGVPRQEYWSGLPFPSPGDLPVTETEPELPESPAWRASSLPLSHLEVTWYLVN